jgi:hypothetical protein
MRTLFLTALVASLSLPISAQDFHRPSDWLIRFAHAAATEADLDMFVAMPPGWHVTSGPAAIYWDPANQAEGRFRVEMEVFLFDPGQRREAFGIFLGGRDLETADQAYTYFLIRNGGQYIVKERDGPDAPTVAPWTDHRAILSYGDRGEDASVRNVLAVEVDADGLKFFVNDAEVWSGPRGDLPVDGMFGFRVNHGLNIHVSRIDVTPLG